MTWAYFKRAGVDCDWFPTDRREYVYLRLAMRTMRREGVPLDRYEGVAVSKQRVRAAA